MVTRGNANPGGATKTSSQWQGGSPELPLRVAAGLGDADREGSLLSSLVGSGEIVIAERCLSADQLLACVHAGQIDAILAAVDLHRLSDERLRELARSPVPLVLLAFDVDDARWQSFPEVVLPINADAEMVRQGLQAALRGEQPQVMHRREEPDVEVIAAADSAEEAPAALSTLAVASGPGSPGRTTVAINLAAALGAVAPTVLVDADLTGPSVAAYLDLDPTRNLSMLAHAEPESPREWDRAIAQEIQPLCPRSQQGFALCGVPKPEMRRSVSSRFFERLVAELRERYRYVILDVGADLMALEAETHRTALAQEVLLVASADIVGLWRARTALGVMQTHLQLDPERVALIVNRHDRRHGHSRTEIEWALNRPVAALAPYDHGGLERALRDQQPVLLNGRSRAARVLLDLAERIHGGSIELPVETSRSGGAGWSRRLPREPWRHQSAAKTSERA